MRWFVCGQCREFCEFEQAMKYATSKESDNTNFVICGEIVKEVKKDRYSISCFHCGSISIKKVDHVWECEDCGAFWGPKSL